MLSLGIQNKNIKYKCIQNKMRKSRYIMKATGNNNKVLFIFSFTY